VPVTGVASHPEDDVVLATALSGSAQYLVTGDHGLLELRTYRDLIIVSVHEFLATLPGLTTA
jgi:predicted nucleic acid-binding protein